MTTWSQEEDDALRELVEQMRYSYNAAAQEMARRFRIRPYNKNAVLGRAHRLGLNGVKHPKDMPHSLTPKERKPKKQDNFYPSLFTGRDPQGLRPKVVMPRKGGWTSGEYKGERTHTLHLVQPHVRQRVDGTCQYIAGNDPKTWTKCGHAVKAGTNYCEFHARLCYQPAVYRNPAPMPSNIRRW